MLSEGKEDEEMTDAEKVQQEISSIQSSSLLILPVLVIPEPTTIKPPEIFTAALATTIPPFTPPLRVSDLEKEVKELKQVDLSTTLHASSRSEVPAAINEYLGSSLGDALQKELQKHTKELRQEYSQKSTSKIKNIKIEHAEKQQKSQHRIKSSNKTALDGFD
nr:hypothetical protein [Tanacetum cinerariifolium]